MMSKHHEFCAPFLVVVLALLATVASPTRVDAQAGAQPSVVIDLGLDEVSGVEYVEAADRLVVTGDDEVQIRTRSGALVHTVSGIAVAVSPQSYGSSVVVGAGGTGSVYVIDVLSGTVTRSIATGVVGLESLSVAGPVVWYLYGNHLNQDEGIGKADLTSGVFENAIFRSSNGGLIVAPSEQASTVFAATYNTKTVVRGSELGGERTLTNSPIVGRFSPFVVTSDGSTVFGFDNWNLIEADGETLEKRGFFFEAIPGWYPAASSIAMHNDQVIALGNGFDVAVYQVGNPSLIGRSNYGTVVVDLDLTSDQLFVVETGRVFAGVQKQYPKPLLTISGFNYAVPDLTVRLEFDAVGLTTSEKSSWRVECGGSRAVVLNHGESVEFQVSPHDAICSFTRQSSPRAVIDSVVWNTVDRQWRGSNERNLRLTGDPTLDVFRIVDIYSVPGDGGEIAPDRATLPPYPWPTGPREVGITAYRAYGIADYTDLEAAAAYLHMSSSRFQLTGVHVLRFINGLVGNVGPAPIGDIPRPTGRTLAVQSIWPAADEVVVDWVRKYYVVDSSEALRVGATLLYFLASIDARQRGTPLPSG